MDELPRAGVLRRTAAFLIDIAFLMIPLLVTTMIISAFAGSVEDGSAGWWVMLALILLEPLAYFTLLEARTGQTLGKRALGLRVVDVDGKPVRLRAALIRNLLRIVDGQPGGFFLVGAAMVAAMPGRQRLGDLAAHTVVVRLAPADIPAPDPALALE